MRRAFVLQVRAESEPANLEFAGCIEEVDTAKERRFRSTAPLLEFLRQCLEDTEARGAATPATEPCEPRGAHRGEDQ
jgi:hypothetical protein